MAGKICCRLRLGLALWVTLVLLIQAPLAAAPEPSFRLDMDSLNLQKGVSCSLVVTLVNAKDAQVVSIDGLGDFEVLSQSQSTSTSIINNVSTYQVDLYLTIMPKTVGTFTLKANIKHGTQNYETNALTVTVGDDTDASGQTPEMFVRTVLSHEEAYWGEKIVATFELYSRATIDGFGFTSYVSIDGVITKSMPDDRLKSETLYIDGNKYTMYEVKQLIIDPLKPGVVTIPSFDIQVNVVSESSIGGLGFGGFFRSTTPTYLKTEEKELLVKPLPTEGKPRDFSGIVGELRLNSQYNRDQIPWGEPLVLQVEASGNCNLDGMKSIIAGYIPGFTVYETQKEPIETVANNHYYVQKAFEVLLIPEKTGTLEIAARSVSYFNPITARYETIEIPETTVAVLGEMPAASASSGNQNSSQGTPRVGPTETVIISQVNYGAASEAYLTLQLPKKQLYTLLLGGASFLALAVGLLRYLMSRKKQEPVLLSTYRQLMASQDIHVIYNLFNSMIKQRYHLNLKANSQNDIRSNLPDAELAKQITDIMEYMESSEAHDENGYVFLKDKIKLIYTTKLR